MKRSLPFLLILVLLVGCGSRVDPESTPETTARDPSSSDIEPPDAPMWPLGIDPAIRYDVFEDLDSYPELVAENIDLLVGSGLIDALESANRALDHGLASPVEDVYLEQLINYCFWAYWRDHSDVPTQSVPASLMREVARYAYADERIADLLPYAARLYHTESDTFEGLYPSNYGFTGRFFSVEGEDDDDGRLIKITFYNENEKPINYTYIDMLRGEDGRLRLRAMWQEPIIDYEITVSGGDYRQVEMTSFLFDGLIGGIDNLAIACESLGDRLLITSLSMDDLSPVRRMELPLDDAEEPLKYSARIRGELIYLYFDDRAMVLDRDLSVQFDEPLPEVLLGLIERGSEYLYDEYRYDYFFGGYELSEDFGSYLYTNEEGLWQHDVASDTSVLLAPHLGDGGRLVGQINHFSPRYSTDGRTIFTSLSVYEGKGRYFRYDLDSKQTHDYQNAEFDTIKLLPVNDFGHYFALSYESTMTIGSNHYVLQKTEYRDGDFDSVFTFERGLMGNLQPEATITLEGAYTSDLGAVMPDGQLIIRAGRAYIGDIRYYIIH